MISFANTQGSAKIRLTCSRVLLSLFLRGSLHALFNPGVKFRFRLGVKYFLFTCIFRPGVKRNRVLKNVTQNNLIFYFSQKTKECECYTR